MQAELLAEGHDVAFLAVNVTSGATSQQSLIDICAFPLFQDVADVGAWLQHGGAKDDILIYDASGSLSAYLPFGGTVSTNLSTPDGYANVKGAILDAL